MFKPFKRTQTQTRKHGLKYALKELFKKYGWKVGVALFFYYLIRDVTLYIIIPYLIYQGLMQG
ncbi:MAG: hypothetical protein Ct9H90mP15_02400 [Candidatus Neomarinimicrobiota bacterium]|nr:MAG: hypothetical protein Ct9H90mP15_02400 [Candidatus Neomarinimicrobiota bacterium]